MKRDHDYDEPPEVSEMREYRVKTPNELRAARRAERELEEEATSGNAIPGPRPEPTDSDD